MSRGSRLRGMAILGLLALFLLSGLPSDAQVTSGSIVGAVQDATGASIPNATVVITNAGTKESRTVTSGANGDYAVNLLDPGSYTVTITAQGFQKFAVNRINLSAGETDRVNGSLALGSVAETVTVDGSTVGALQTDSSTIQSSVDTKSVQDLPLNGRNFVNLVQQAPGVNAGNPTSISSGGAPDDRRQSSSVSANGQGQQYNNQQIDGLDNNEREQGVIGVRPSIDAISEIRILTNNYPAEVGRASGAVVNVITKAGSNSVHGTAFEYFRNDIFDARNFFATTGRKPELRQNQFGGSVGGPIFRDKTFFFAAYEGFRSISGVTFNETVPTAFEEANPGNFSDIGGDIVTPVAAALNYFKLYPAPNQAGTLTNGEPIHNFVYSPTSTLYSTTLDARIDHKFNANNSIFAHYSYNPVTTFNPGQLPPTMVNGALVQSEGVDNFGDNFNNIAGPSTIGAQGINLEYQHIFSPHLVLELKDGFTRLSIKTNPLNYGQNLSSSFGIVNGNLGTPDSTGLTNITFFTGPYASLGDGYFVPINDINNTYQENGAVTYSRGQHNVKVGAALIRRQLNYFQDQFNPQGGFLFFNLSGHPGGEMASFLQGKNVLSDRGNLLIKPGYRTWESSAFAQDDWHAAKNLVLNLGVRYDVYTPFTEAHNQYSNFNPTTAVVNLVGQSGLSPTLNVATQYRHIQPRLGFSMELPGEAVLRGGFGISFFPVDFQNIIQNPNPPYSFECFPCANASFPVLPLPAVGSLTNLSGTLTYKDPKLGPAYTEMFNLTGEKRFGNNTFTIAYVGELQRKLLYQGDLDRPLPSGNATTPAFIYGAQLPNVNTITRNYNGGAGSYNALQVSLVRRAGKGLTFFTNYTFAHGLTNAETAGSSTSDPGLIPSRPSYDYGSSDLNIQQRFAISLSYTLPSVQGGSRLVRALTNGWEANILGFWQTGLPFTVLSGNATINLPGVSSDRPNQLRNGNISNHSLTRWFDTTAFVDQPIGTPGNEQPNSLYGPHDRRVDFSLFRNIPLYDRFKMQLRAECFNISNTPNFSRPDSSFGTGFGTISSTVPNEFPREYEFAAKILF